MARLVLPPNIYSATSVPALSASFLGQVATGCKLVTNFAAPNKQATSRSPHTAMDNITSLKIVLPGWYGQASSTLAETAIGSATTYTASIEYPAGTMTQVLFSGSATGTCASGANLVSDFVTVTIPKGARFWVRVFYQNATGLVYISNGIDLANGAAFEYAASGLTDQTMSGTVSTHAGGTQSNGNSFAPLAIIANTRAESYFLFGDSRVAGSKDAYFGPGAGIGSLERSVEKFAPCINAGNPGERLDWFIANHTNRMALAAYCSRAIMAIGINDVIASVSDATIAANEQTILGYFGSKKVYICTMEPSASSTDSWATTANQTPITNNPVRILTNTRRRHSATGFAGCIDLADLVEEGRNNGKWQLTPTVYGAPTTDGIHGNREVYLHIARSGAITAATVGT
ncbi:hypothetical protein J2R95_003174 [Bradyrhizobium japonicum]|uniref:hypothetical protein n=1 Tax=Bradyrhizobium japonicum TaxID=375 RepID=UPI00209D343D|nr:hypothetical protein [Bradyrhizobium japonicum]MCP1937379.1 hypothetical protein [Bradyrhizobium japonicum]